MSATGFFYFDDAQLVGSHDGHVRQAVGKVHLSASGHLQGWFEDLPDGVWTKVVIWMFNGPCELALTNGPVRTWEGNRLEIDGKVTNARGQELEAMLK